MKRIALSAFAIVGAVVVGAGCGNTLFPLASDQLFETQVRAQCAFAFNCCEAVERTGAGVEVRNPDEGACIEQGLETGGDLAVLGQRAKAAVDAGTAVYDGDLAERCLRPMLDAGKACSPEFIGYSFDTECAVAVSRAFVIGQVKDGDDCIDSLECADEGDCIVDDDDDDALTVSGTCLGRAGEGDECGERACQSGLFCDVLSDTPTCTPTQLLDDGERCGGDNQCSSNNCLEVDTGTCFGSDEPCGNNADCDDGDFCNASSELICAAEGEGDDSDLCNGRE